MPEADPDPSVGAASDGVVVPAGFPFGGSTWPGSGGGFWWSLLIVFGTSTASSATRITPPTAAMIFWRFCFALRSSFGFFGIYGFAPSALAVVDVSEPGVVVVGVVAPGVVVAVVSVPLVEVELVSVEDGVALGAAAVAFP